MKNLFAFLAAAVLFAFISCKKVKDENMTVIRDCTGTYLRYDGKDYRVCNKEKLEAYSDNAEVMATFKKTGSCSDDDVYCLMAHAYESMVEVTEVR